VRKLIYFVAATIDGFIAAPDGGIDFFPLEPDLLDFVVAEYPETLPTHVRTRIGLDAPNRVFDTLVMGKGTYDPALALGITSPYAHLKQYVFSRTAEAAPEPEVEIVTGDPVELVRRLKLQDGLDIWLCGGGDLAAQLLPEVDELVVKLNPVLAGAGIPLLRSDFNPTPLTLRDTRPLPGGVVVLRYSREGN
jgi:dihydrofolate reductase